MADQQQVGQGGSILLEVGQGGSILLEVAHYKVAVEVDHMVAEGVQQGMQGRTALLPVGDLPVGGEVPQGCGLHKKDFKLVINSIISLSLHYYNNELTGKMLRLSKQLSTNSFNLPLTENYDTLLCKIENS